MKIAFLGLGAMGSRMAMNILDAGHELTVWNRTSGKAGALTGKGAREAETPREAAEGAELVLSMLIDDDASRSVWTAPETGALAGMAPGTVAVECSTISVDWCRRLAIAAAEREVRFLEAPVAGTLQPAESGDLVIIAGGDKAAIETARPAFEAMGKATHHAGDNGAGSAVKLLVNGMLAVQEAELAELLGLMKKLDVDHRRAFDILCETPVASPMLKAYGKLMIEGTEEVNFPVGGILKDLGLIEGEAGRRGAAAPVSTATRESFGKAADAGLRDRNQTEILRLFE